MITINYGNHLDIDALHHRVESAQTILILQPDSPDGDSFWTALGLEEILGDMGKTVTMFSYRAPEPYLRILEGWDRVSQTFPRDFDLTILLDTGSPALIKATLEHHQVALTRKPIVIIDHHTSRSDFGFTHDSVVTEAVATAELVTRIADQLNWPVSAQAAQKLAAAILSDSLGLTTSGTSAFSVAALTQLVARGADLGELNRVRREASALDPGQVHLKGELIRSIRFEADGRLAIAILSPEIVAANTDRFEPYNMIISEMQWAAGVEVAAVFKNYGGKINVPLRSRDGLAGPLAEHLGGGGHPNAGAYRCETGDIASEVERFIAAFISFRSQINDPTAKKGTV